MFYTRERNSFPGVFFASFGPPFLCPDKPKRAVNGKFHGPQRGRENKRIFSSLLQLDGPAPDLQTLIDQGKMLINGSISAIHIFFQNTLYNAAVS